MAKELIINASLPEVRIALMEDGRIQELLIERESDKGIVGNIYKGRVTRVLPGMQAAFVDVGLDKAAFLYVDDIYVHPKVMGEENEVVDEDEEDEEESRPEQKQGRGGKRNSNQERTEEQVNRPKPSGAFVARPASTDAAGTESAAAGEIEAGLAQSENGEHASEFTSDEVQALEASGEHTETHYHEHTHDDAELEAHQHSESHDYSEDEESEEEEDEEEEGADAAFEAAHEFESDEDENDSESDSEDEGDDDSDEASAEGNDLTGELSENGEAIEGQAQTEEQIAAGGLEGLNQGQGRNARGGRGRNRNRKRGRGRKGPATEGRTQFAGGETSGEDTMDLPDSFNESVNDGGQVTSDRAQMEGESGTSAKPAVGKKVRPEFREQRNRDRRIKTKHTRPRAQANIADLLKEGQEVIVQIAKDPIATKGARLTCHVSLPGRHLVCMPSIDHVGVSRRIERDDERRRLRDFVERNRPRKMGFIVRTASGGKDPESWIKQDIDYLSKLWGEIRGKADEVSAPALVYEDLNSILRAIRDWVNEDIDKIIVDSRYHYNELQAFADRFMPALHEKLELYHGDVPIFDAYGISSELHRSLERKVWLKSGGYLVIDQAEALVAIDVNTGRYVGKKSLEDTILKTNIEAAEEIAHQLRLRNCGGIIICDFIDMEREDNRMRVYRALDEALKKDRARPTIQKISELGLVEMTRKRTRDTIIRSLCEPCAHCEGKGFVKTTLTVAYEILREIERLSVDREAKKILVSAHENVVNALAIELRDALDQLERRYNKTVYLQTVMDFHSEQFEVVTDRAPNKKATQDIARTLRVERERSERKEKTRGRAKQDQVQGRGSFGGEAQDPEEVTEAAPVEREANNRGGRDRNRGGRDRNRDQNRDQNRNQNASANADAENTPVEGASENEAAIAAAPVARPSGSFVTARAGAPAQQSSGGMIPEKKESQANVEAAFGAGEDVGASDEDAQPSFTDEEVRQSRSQTPSYSQAGYEDEMNDEDRLAYLRAQAAQDAAIAGLGQQSPNGNRAQNNRGGRGGAGGGDQQNRGNGRPQNNNRNPRGGGRNQNAQRNAGAGNGANPGNGAPGNQRFKPHHRNAGMNMAPNGNNPGNVAASSLPPVVQQAPTETQIPDYEVISRGDGSDS